MRTSLLLLLLFLSFQAFAKDLAEPYISEGACPFEGCSYGEWNVQKQTNIYLKPNKNSKIIGTLNPGESVTALTGNLYVYAGIAKITGNPYKESKDLNIDEMVYILDYVGEGRTRIYQNGKFYITKIATTNDQCKDKNDWRRCWVEVVKEPESFWWVKVQYKKSIGWVLIEKGNIKPIDRFS